MPPEDKAVDHDPEITKLCVEISKLYDALCRRENIEMPFACTDKDEETGDLTHCILFRGDKGKRAAILGVLREWEVMRDIP